MGVALLIGVFVVFIAVLLSLALFWIKLMPVNLGNLPIVENRCPWKTKGFSKGILLSKTVGRGGRFLVTFRPTDIDLESKNAYVPDSVSLIVGPNNLDVLPKGTYSAFRDTMVINPNDAHDVDQSLVKTGIGKHMISRSTIADNDNILFANTKEQLVRVRHITNSLAGGEASDAKFRADKNVFDTLLEKKKNAEKGSQIPLVGNYGR